MSDVPRERVPTGESLVALTRDRALVETLSVLGAEHSVVTVEAESDLAGELLSKQTGVAIIDAAAVSSAVERLTERLKSQFPDLVLIVAGRLDDQSALAAQITSGTVYRFLHKPVSEQRVKLFVDAAWRRHGEDLSGGADPMGTTGLLTDERAPLPRNTLIVGGLLLAALVVASGWFMTRKPGAIATPTSQTGEAPLPVAARDEQLETLLARADKTFEAGAIVTPAGENAAELYKQALHRNGSDPRAAAGIERVIDKLLSAAEAQLAARNLDEAQRLTEQARAIKPDHVRVAFLAARIGKERERSVSSQARRAASSGNIEQAIAVLDGAAQDGKHSTLVAEARAALEQKQLDERVDDLTREAQRVQTTAEADAMARLVLLFNQRLTQGRVLEPPTDSAKFYLHQLVQADATHPSTVLARQALAGRALDEARAAVLRRDLTGARRWLTEARAAGSDEGSVDAVEQDMTAAQDNTQRAAEIVSAGSLELAHYVPPTFPASALARGLSGWVDLQFVVRSDGSVSDVLITGAEPVGIFEQAAVDAVRKWRYEPAQRDGHTVDQRARLRMKFALDK